MYCTDVYVQYIYCSAHVSWDTPSSLFSPLPSSPPLPPHGDGVFFFFLHWTGSSQSHTTSSVWTLFFAYVWVNWWPRVKYSFGAEIEGSESLLTLQYIHAPSLEELDEDNEEAIDGEEEDDDDEEDVLAELIRF